MARRFANVSECDTSPDLRPGRPVILMPSHGMDGTGADLSMLPGSLTPPDLAAIDHAVLERWERDRITERAMARSAGRPPWTFAKAPLTANGMPGMHHVPATVITDLYARYKAMRGFQVPRGATWNCDGLPVEVAVEKELGLAGPQAIEAYGVDQFSSRCRESADRHIDVLSLFEKRIGFVTQKSQTRRTMDASQVELVWGALRAAFEAGLLVRERRVGPYCPRCQTALGDHELGLPGGYRSVADPSVIVRLGLDRLPDEVGTNLGGADLLVWTRCAWSLVANAAVAVNPDQTYAIARRAGHGERVIIAEAAFARVLGEHWHIAARVRGADLVGASYRPAFGGLRGAHRVVPGRFVRPGVGTGLAHLAPAYGSHDLAAAMVHELPVNDPIGPDGHFDSRLPLVGGVFFAEADPLVIANLADRGLLLASSHTDRRRPHCWRCGTRLLNRLRPAWYVRTTSMTDRLAAAVDKITWSPAEPALSLFRADWAVSRSRYWGTPLPIWECAEGHLTCAGSLAELSVLAGDDLTGLDPHRPAIDRVIIRCPRCGATGRRVPEVVDAWFDAGVQQPDSGSPPARLIAAAADQARGWFGALLTVGAIESRRPVCETALQLAPVANRHGRATRTRDGAVLDPAPLLERYGADATRWFFATRMPRSGAARVIERDVEELSKNVLLRYWNTVAFWNRHNATWGSWPPDQAEPDWPAPVQRPVLDRWVLSQLQCLIIDVTKALDRFDSVTAGHRIAHFIADMSNWYVRRTRRRLTDGGCALDGAAAFFTLGECLEALTRLMAPMAPFITDHAWQLIRAGDVGRPGSGADAELGTSYSVHLARWPVANESLIDHQLAHQVALVRKLAELGRAVRAKQRIPIRQPLAAALAVTLAGAKDGVAELPADLRALVADELNVMSFDVVQGPAFSPPLENAGVPAGWSAASGDGFVVAVDPVITAELRRIGLARRAIRVINDARKRAGLAYGQQIALDWSCADVEVGAAMVEHEQQIRSEVRAVDYRRHPAQISGPQEHLDGLTGLRFWFKLCSG